MHKLTPSLLVLSCFLAQSVRAGGQGPESGPVISEQPKRHNDPRVVEAQRRMGRCACAVGACLCLTAPCCPTVNGTIGAVATGLACCGFAARSYQLSKTAQSDRLPTGEKKE